MSKTTGTIFRTVCSSYPTTLLTVNVFNGPSEPVRTAGSCRCALPAVLARGCAPPGPPPSRHPSVQNVTEDKERLYQLSTYWAKGWRGLLFCALGGLMLNGCAASAPLTHETPANAGTIWTWQGEHRISEFVEIPAGVTLILAPGTTLRFAFIDRDGDGVGDAGLHVRGRIEAVGTPTAPITLTSAEGRPQPGDWQGLVFDNSKDNLFVASRFEYAQHALHAHFSAARLERCRLERNIEGTRLGNSSFTIEHCLVRGNVSKGLNFFGCSNAIRRNLIAGNADGLFLFEFDADSVVEANNFVDNQRYDVRLGDFYRGGKRLGENWFGTTDRAAIRKRVFDGDDDPELGRLEFTPAPAPFVTGWEGEP